MFDVELLDFSWRRRPDARRRGGRAEGRQEDGLGPGVQDPQAGKGKEHPTADSTVEVHYTGWTTDGKMFDSSVTRGKPATFPLDGVIKGWTEGVQLMDVGDKARFWIPGNLAYGDKPDAPRRARRTLVFDIELISMK